MRALLLLSAVLPACLPVPVYRIQRTARVPHATAPLRTGAPLDGAIEASFGASSVGDVRRPTLADRDASIEVPGAQVRGELRLRIRRRVELAALYERAIARTFRPLDPSQAPVEEGTAQGRGLGLRYAIPFEGAPNLSLALGIEAWIWSIPYVEYRTCVAECEAVSRLTIERGTSMVQGGALSLGLAYRSGSWTYGTGMHLARHPTIARKSETSFPEAESDVESGDVNMIAHAGVEYRLGPASLLVRVQRDLTAAPVSYGPSFGFAIAVHTPEPRKCARTSAPGDTFAACRGSR
jgi:hypothetical protein